MLRIPPALSAFDNRSNLDNQTLVPSINLLDVVPLPLHTPLCEPPPSGKGLKATSKNTTGGPTAMGLCPLGKLRSGWGSHTTATTSVHTRLGDPCRRAAHPCHGEPQAVQPTCSHVL